MTNWNIFFNLDFIYYLIYLFFKSIFGWFTLSGNVGNSAVTTSRDIGLFSLLKFMANSGADVSPEAYKAFGQGIGALYDGYSLFRPPFGLEEFGSFSAWWTNFTTNPYCPSCSSFADLFFGGFNTVLWFLIIILMGGLIFIKFKMEEIEEIEKVKYDTVYDSENHTNYRDNPKDLRWAKILKLSKSQNVNDWKAAIIDADNLLEETLKENGYPGNTLGEILKQAKFDTLQNAWTAHNVRNKIAHDPTFILTEKETKRVIQNFSKVFSEFYYL